MASATNALLTVDEAREIAAENPDKKYELQYGELVEVTQPKFNHQDIQEQLRDLLRAKLHSFGRVYTECAYRGIPEYDARRADIGMISWERRRQALELNEFFGAPDLVVEILSPSNRAGKWMIKKHFVFLTAARAFGS